MILLKNCVVRGGKRSALERNQVVQNTECEQVVFGGPFLPSEELRSMLVQF